MGNSSGQYPPKARSEQHVPLFDEQVPLELLVESKQHCLEQHFPGLFRLHSLFDLMHLRASAVLLNPSTPSMPVAAPHAANLSASRRDPDPLENRLAKASKRRSSIAARSLLAP
jgi:hypothetical protein